MTLHVMIGQWKLKPSPPHRERHLPVIDRRHY
jgi:hypothetical protein